MLGIVAFFAAVIAPPVAFSAYVTLKRGWPLTKVAPYLLCYWAAFSALLAWGMSVTGWDFVIAIGIGLVLALLSFVDWGRLLDDLAKARRKAR